MRALRNLTAADLFSDSERKLFCGHSTKVSVPPCQGSDAGSIPAVRSHSEFNEEQSDEGPDPHDDEVESEMEREARDE